MNVLYLVLSSVCLLAGLSFSGYIYCLIKNDVEQYEAWYWWVPSIMLTAAYIFNQFI